jgi:acyl-CoA thioesterase-2
VLENDADLLDVLQLEQIEQNMFRANLVLDEQHPLYGGQVAAQALLAAGLTVDADRRPHSLHGYFLRKGDSSRPTLFNVFPDRDGRSFSARRVVAIQNGAVIFNMSASFQIPQDGPSVQVDAMPTTEAPEESPIWVLPRLFSCEARRPTQPYGDAFELPTRFWARTTAALPAQPLLHACALTYVSDMSTGVLPAADGSVQSGSSIDHAVWFHRDVDMAAWTLLDFQARTAAQGRGWYTGSIYSSDGRLVASVAQETLFR